jgi:membrane fusion protein (multidrug efflux system)
MTYSKNINMKSSLYARLLIAITVAGLLAACSAASNDTDKKARLEKLKTQQADLAKEITKLENEIAKENPGAAKSTAKPKEVSTLELSTRKFDHFVQTQGSVESENNIVVSARSAGVITQVFVTEGQQVSKGQTLAQIDNAVMARNIESMKSQLELATSVYNRQKNLWDQKIGTEVQFLEAKSKKENLEKQVESLQEQNDMFRIKSPINGTVDEVKAKIGENAAPGAPAFRVVNGSDLKLTARISEAYVTNIKKGNAVVVTIPELKQDINAKVTFVGNNIDPLSRTFNVEVKLPSLANLRPNMTATIRVIFQTEKNAIVVPVNAIQSLNEEKIVYIADSDGKQTVARKKVVTIDGVYANEAQVEGLKAGDKLISVGYQGLNDGDPIKL